MEIKELRHAADRKHRVVTADLRVAATLDRSEEEAG